MRLSQLRTKNFRNLVDNHIHFSPGIVMITGPNGSGKTNLLEAITVAVTATSPRTRFAHHMIRTSPTNTSFQTTATFISHNGVEINASARSSAARRIVQAITPSTPIPLTFFSPDDLALIKAGPSHRRRFIDQLLFATDKAYIRAWKQYRTSLLQRNSLLRQRHSSDTVTEQLSVWDSRISTTAGDLMRRRHIMCDHIAIHFRTAHALITNTSPDDISITYAPALLSQPTDKTSSSAWAETFLEQLLQRRSSDMSKGYTSLGPHRDDILIDLAQSEARLFASQGQQRTLALALRSAQHALLEEHTGEAGTLLLDDVASELDQQRRERLLTAFSGRQTIITSTDLSLFPTPDQSLILQMGKVI